MKDLQFYIRHSHSFLQEKMLLVFKSDEARDYFQKSLKNCTFERITAEMAQHIVRIGIGGKIVPYGYTYELSKEEMNRLDTSNWRQTARLLAEGNERFYKKMRKKADVDTDH